MPIAFNASLPQRADFSLAELDVLRMILASGRTVCVDARGLDAEAVQTLSVRGWMETWESPRIVGLYVTLTPWACEVPSLQVNDYAEGLATTFGPRLPLDARWPERSKRHWQGRGDKLERILNAIDAEEINPPVDLNDEVIVDSCDCPLMIFGVAVKREKRKDRTA